MKIGSHVSMSGKKMLLGSIEETIKNGANCLMIYTGAPQNTRRKPIDELMISEAHELMKKNDISKDDIIIHAPYIINLGNSKKPETFEIGVEFLKKEISRTEAIGAKYLVLHPGAHVGEGVEAGIKKIIEGLNASMTKDQQVIVCLETMAGKGTEIGRTFNEIAQIIAGVEFPEKIGVCMDTCHLNDAGYDLSNFDNVLDEFDTIVGLNKLKVMHLNDSMNTQGAGKDRHDNIGYGHIGWCNLHSIANNQRIKNICKLLETPYTNKRTISPYQQEIEMLRNGIFIDWLDEDRNIKE